jgi:hypothetical protein
VRLLVRICLRNWCKDERSGSGTEFRFLARTRHLCSIRAMLERIRCHPNRIVAGAPVSTNTVARGPDTAMSVTRPDVSFRSCCREDKSKSNGPGGQCGSPPSAREGRRLGRGLSGIRTSAPLSGAINAVELSARRSCHIATVSSYNPSALRSFGRHSLQRRTRHQVQSSCRHTLDLGTKIVKD